MQKSVTLPARHMRVSTGNGLLTLSQTAGQYDICDRGHDDLEQSRICGIGEGGIDLLRLAPVQPAEALLKVATRSIEVLVIACQRDESSAEGRACQQCAVTDIDMLGRVRRTVVVRKVRFDARVRDLCSENVHLV